MVPLAPLSEIQILVPDENAKLFPSLFGQPSAILVPGESNESGYALKIGFVLSGGQAPGGHNVIYLGFLITYRNAAKVPDILIVLSDLTHFVKVLSLEGTSEGGEEVKCMCVNSGRLARGEGGGHLVELNFHELLTTLPTTINEQVSWVVGGLVLTAWLLFVSARNQKIGEKPLLSVSSFV
ncbi:hypothetical protein Lser_V15G40072 [Lactuca serriola]